MEKSNEREDYYPWLVPHRFLVILLIYPTEYFFHSFEFIIVSIFSVFMHNNVCFYTMSR